ncbi:tyrosine-type recombinase/integrase [Reinekea sp. G2M2-21]|uniref:tyrosine-type recombinase/integrase n=1 Tax=Reinekea sp. G2M2-21 TaxID=2788942 RepID=UPI0018AC405B|nr:tyrosine-type recombinase/integrase [Reinekea sp. G2M2-21]
MGEIRTVSGPFAGAGPVVTERDVPWLAPVESFALFRLPVGDYALSDAAWIYRYLCNGCRTPKTRKAVQSEMLRLAYFMAKRKIARFADITSDHAAMYHQWLRGISVDADGQPEDRSVDVNTNPRTLRFVDGRLNPAWRPFRSEAPLAPNAIKTALNLISGCLSFIADAPESTLTGNPFRRLTRLKAEKAAIDAFNWDAQPYRRALSVPALNTIQAYIESVDFVGHERSRAANRWLVQLLYSTAVRVESLAALKDSCLRPAPMRPGEWELVFMAKAGVQVQQAWSTSQMAGLVRYRTAIGLHWPPMPGESRQFWLGIGRADVVKSGQVTEGSVWLMVRNLGKVVIAWLTDPGSEGPGYAKLLTSEDWHHLDHLHPHTFRHSWITHYVNGGSDDSSRLQRLGVAQDHAGHASITMTERYVAKSSSMVNG